MAFMNGMDFVPCDGILTCVLCKEKTLFANKDCLESQPLALPNQKNADADDGHSERHHQLRGTLRDEQLRDALRHGDVEGQRRGAAEGERALLVASLDP